MLRVIADPVAPEFIGLFSAGNVHEQYLNRKQLVSAGACCKKRRFEKGERFFNLHLEVGSWTACVGDSPDQIATCDSVITTNGTRALALNLHANSSKKGASLKPAPPEAASSAQPGSPASSCRGLPQARPKKFTSRESDMLPARGPNQRSKTMLQRARVSLPNRNGQRGRHEKELEKLSTQSSWELYLNCA